MNPSVDTPWRRLDRLSPQAAFAWVAGVFGLLMVFVTPPFQVPDEPNHWYRAYRVSDGHAVDVRATSADRFEYGGAVPTSLIACSQKFERMGFDPNGRFPIAAIVSEARRPLRADETTEQALPNTALYSPVPYAPAALAIGVARLLAPPPLALLYAGRLATLAAYVALGWLAIRTTPLLKWPAALVLGGPMGLFLAASVSADPLTTAFGFLATASVLARCTIGSSAGTTPDAAVGWRRWTDLPLWPSLVGLALCKSAYVPLAFVALAIPARTWRRRVGLVALVAVTVAVATAWSALTRPMHTQFFADDVPAVQLRWVRANPAAFLAVCWRTARDHWFDYAYSSTGKLGWLDAPMPVPFVVGYLILIVYLAVACGEPVRLRWPARALAATAVLSSTFLLALAMYVMWNHTAAAEILGIQGRYFLPLALAGLAVIRRGGGLRVPTWTMLAVQVLTGAYTVVTLVGRYHVPAWRQ